MKIEQIITDSLGFPLAVTVSIVENLRVRGRHVTYEQEGKVLASAEHHIEIREGLLEEEKSEVIAHECYHLFYSIRHLITRDEEIEAEVFGHLVKRIHKTLEA
jgi:hypothetical protein